MGAVIKQIAVFAVVVVAIAAWTMHDSLRSSEAQGSKAPQSSRADYARQLRDNAPLRTRLQQKYPDTYRDLAGQSRRDLSSCVITEIVPGVLKATCL